MLRNLIIIGIAALLGHWVGFSTPTATAEENGEATSESSSRFTDKVPGLKEQDDLPKGPRPLVEFGQGYLLEGPYDYEFELPTGMVVSPGLVFFGDLSSGLEITDTGVGDADVAWVSTVNMFANLTLSGTERIMFGISPLTRESGAKTQYQFTSPSGLEDQTNLRLTTAFFEGEISEMFPGLDMDGRRPLDYEIAIGRQGVNIQDGVIINDTLESVALTRSTIPFAGSNFARISGLMAWNNIQRSSNKDDEDGELYGLFSSVEMHHAMMDLNLVYVDSSDAIGDQFNIGFSRFRPYILFEHDVDTTFHFAYSHTPDNETAHATKGGLVYSSFSWAPRGTVDIMYVNAFGAFDHYAAAARGAGGALGITGLMFAGNGLAGAPISNGSNDAYGGSMGYQMFFSGALRRNLIFEVGGKIDNSSGGINRGGAAVRYSQAIGEQVFFEVGAFAVSQESTDDKYGLRTKMNVIF